MKEKCFIVTGAAGFIGSCLVKELNDNGFYNLLLVDDFSRPKHNKNLKGKKFIKQIDREEFLDWLKENHQTVHGIYHIGARTDTTEFDKQIFTDLNLNYSKQVWALCSNHNIPLVYASSAATYGNGELGYNDNHEIVQKLEPLNPYGESKNEFDKWVLQQNNQPPFWAGLKFFNVYGPNEYHKGRMASVVYHAYKQIKETGKVKLFRSHKDEYENGKQLRDFIYVKDVIKVCSHLMAKQPKSGLFNLGTGNARTFLALAEAVFSSIDEPANIEFIDTPSDIRDKYQYFTEANMEKLRSVGYSNPFTQLEDGVKDYVTNYLEKSDYY